MKWIHHRYVADFNEMTDLGKVLRDKLEAHAEVRVPQVQFEKPSTDSTHKGLLGMYGNKAIDVVFVPAKGRCTLCVTSPVASALTSQFCSTATQGFKPNLSTAQLLARHSVPHQPPVNVPLTP